MTTEGSGPTRYDAGKKSKGRRRHFVVDVNGLPIVILAHVASILDRDGASVVIEGNAQEGTERQETLGGWGVSGPKLSNELKKLDLGDLLEIVKKPKGIKGFEVLPRR